MKITESDLRHSANERRKISLVTFPCDFGSLAVEKNLTWLLEQFMDLTIYRFGCTQKNFIDVPERGIQARLQRVWQSMALMQHLYKCQLYEIPVLIYGMSPVLHSYPFHMLFPGSCSQLVDWTRTLSNEYEHKSDIACIVQQALVRGLYKQGLSKIKRILVATDVVGEEVLQTYKIERAKLRRITLPINTDLFTPAISYPELSEGNRPKVLFVGGDLKRKGADLLIDWWARAGHALCGLTIATNIAPRSDLPAGIDWCTGIQYGTKEHVELYRRHDILCHPSHFDSWGLVIAESAACGLAIVTTRNTLGHVDVIVPGQNGLVASTADECIKDLECLLKQPERIVQMKKASHEHVIQKFNASRLFRQIALAMNLVSQE